MYDRHLSRRSLLAGALAVPFLRGAAVAGENLGAIIVGCGNRGAQLATMMAAMSEPPAPVAFIDTVVGKAAALRDRISPSAPVYASLDAAFDAGVSAQTAIVATWNSEHLPVIEPLLAKGYHVFCEKPMTESLSEARRMVELDRKYGGRIHIGLEFRYAPLYRRVKEIIDSGRIGDVKYMAAAELRGDWFRYFPDDDARENQTNWRYFEKTCGNSILEKLCHDFDILTYVGGKTPSRVIASGGKAVYTNRETDDHASIILEYSDGAVMDCSFSLFSSAPRDETIIMGSRGTLAFRRVGQEISVWNSLKPKGKPDELISLAVSKRDVDNHSGTMESLVAFFSGVRDRGAIYPSPEQAWMTTAICCAAHHSARNQSAPVDLRVEPYVI